MKTAIIIVAGWTLLSLAPFAFLLLRRDPATRAKLLLWGLPSNERQRRKDRATSLRWSR